MTRTVIGVALALLVSSFQLIAPSLAEAHERRSVGPYQLVVGWLNEPAIQAQPNAATVRVSDTRAAPAKAVTGLEQTISIEIASGGLAPFSGAVRAVFGQPGLYALDVIPTAAGSYRFTIRGRIEDLAVEETFESGPGRFDDVEAAAAIQYPERVPAGGALGERLDDIDRKLGSLQALAIVALALAVVLPVGLAAAARRSRR